MRGLAQRTVGLVDREQILAKVTGLFKNAKTQVLVFTNADTFAITTNNESLRTLKREARERGIKLRYITEITKENLSFCKQQMTLVDELRHLDGARGNFVLSESEFIVSPEISEKYPMTNGTYGDIDSMLRQYWHLFETLWNHAIPAEHRVKELETIADSDVLIPNRRLEIALDMVLTPLGPGFRDMIIANLRHGGIDLRSNETKYSLKDLRIQLDMFFGGSVGHVFFEMLNQKLDEEFD